MASSLPLLVFLGLVVLNLARAQDANYSFPKDFMFGAATAAYQVEGAWNENGKGENIYDHMYHEHPENSIGQQNGDVTDDSYHLYKEDVQMLKNLGMTHYRFSISWARVLPTGEANNINQAGIDYYNNLINELLANGIQPMVTMYHFDLPQWLQDLGGWTNPIIADYFEDYARILYENFGDRVKWWFTFNEPLSIIRGYAMGYLIAPAINKPGVGDYLATHHILISHARAYHLYDNGYRASQQGKVSIVINSDWLEPKTNSTEDIEAAERALQFNLGLFAHPIFSTEGDYPAVVRERVANNSKAEGRSRSRLPTFSKEMVEYIKGTADFFALNSYSTSLISNAETATGTGSRDMDSGTEFSADPSWPVAGVSWLHVVPWGFRKQIKWVHDNYNAPDIIITENGYSDNGTLDDVERISYFKDYLAELLKVKYEDGVNVFGYTAWSLMDNFEWFYGFTAKFGIYSVNFTDPARTRTPKASVNFWKTLISTRQIPED